MFCVSGWQRPLRFCGVLRPPVCCCGPGGHEQENVPGKGKDYSGTRLVVGFDVGCWPVVGLGITVCWVLFLLVLLLACVWNKPPLS